VGGDGREFDGAEGGGAGMKDGRLGAEARRDAFDRSGEGSGEGKAERSEGERTRGFR